MRVQFKVTAKEGPEVRSETMGLPIEGTNVTVEEMSGQVIATEQFLEKLTGLRWQHRHRALHAGRGDNRRGHGGAVSARLFWLSFVDPDTGASLGACVVQVTVADVTRMRPAVEAFAQEVRPPELPPIDEEAIWRVTATRVARERGCNPGGEVASWEISLEPPFPMFTVVPEGRARTLGKEAVRWHVRVHCRRACRSS